MLLKNMVDRAGNQAGWIGLGRVNSGIGQNRIGSKLTWFFSIKILVAQPILKTGLVGLNSLLNVKKNRMDRIGSGHNEPSHIGQD